MTLAKAVRNPGQDEGVGRVKGPWLSTMRLSACATSVFVEANGVVAGVEALVLEEGACDVWRLVFLEILRAFRPKKNFTLEADANGLRIERFVMETTGFSPVAAAPGKFRVFPVADAWLAHDKTATTKPDSRFLNSRRRA